MTAFGPDFKQHFVDPAPVSSVDLAKTFAQILKLDLPVHGRLVGRILSEALKGGPDNVAFETKSKESEPASNGQVTKLNYQLVGKTKYFDTAGFPGRSVGLDATNGNERQRTTANVSGPPWDATNDRAAVTC